jgi:hypothetical protein
MPHPHAAEVLAEHPQCSCMLPAPVRGAFMEYSAMRLSGRLAMKGRAGRPQLASRCSSTKSTPHTTRFMSLQVSAGNVFRVWQELAKVCG